MEKAAIARGMEADIFAVSASEADGNLETKPIDVMLLGPQVRFMRKEFEKIATVPVDVIDMLAYGRMEGEKVLDSALAMMKKE